MKGFVVAIGAALFAGLSVAQNLTEINNLPPCGKVCITNMLGQAAALGCSSEADVVCLCKNTNFKYGIRDCVNESCPPADIKTVLDFGNGICAAAAGTSGVETVTATQTAGTTTLVVSTGTDSAGHPFTTTLGALGAPPTGVGVVLTTTNSAGSTFTTTFTVAASGQQGNASLITTTNSAGQTTVITASPSATGAPGVIVLTGTNSAGSIVVTTITGNSTAAATNGTASVIPATTLVTTNSAGSTITTTKAATTASGTAGAGTGTTTAAATSSGAAGHLAGPVFGGVAGLLALAFL